MAKGSTNLEKQLRESDQKLQKIQRELQVSSGAVLEAQRIALSIFEEVGSCCQQLEGVEEQLDMAHAKDTSAKAAGDEAAARSKGELACSQKKCDLSQQQTAAAESVVTSRYKELEVVTAKVGTLK